MRSRQGPTLAWAVGALMLSGCATVSSEHVGTGQQLGSGLPAPPECRATRPPASCVPQPGAQVARAGSAGIAYFLPRQLARVTAARTRDKLNELVTAVIKAEADLDKAQASVDAGSAAVRLTEDAIIEAKGGAAAQPILDARLKAQKAELVTTKATLERAKADFAKAKTTLTSAAVAPPGATPAFKVALKIELLPPTADPSQGYLLSPHHTPFRDDEHKLVVSEAGLLTSTDTIASDRTADILLEIATFAGGLSGLSPPVPVADEDGVPPPPPPPRDPCATSPDEFAAMVDFADPVSVAALNVHLQCLGVRTAIAGQHWPASTRPKPTRANSVEGIVYRTPVPVQVQVEKCVKTAGACAPGDPDWFATEILFLSLPQAGPISYVRQDAGFMTRSRYTLAFKDGLLTNYDASRPSEILEVARTPMRLVNGVFQGISQVISLRTGRNTGLAGLTASERAVLEAQVALQASQINGRRTVSESELALLRAQYALQAAPIEGQRTLSAAELALLQQQIALQAGGIEGQRSLSAAELALLQQQFALQTGGVAGQTGLANAEIALIQAQLGRTIAQNGVAAQLSTSELAAAVTLLRNRARQEALNRCVSQQVAAGQPVDICLAGF